MQHRFAPTLASRAATSPAVLGLAALALTACHPEASVAEPAAPGPLLERGADFAIHATGDERRVFVSGGQVPHWAPIGDGWAPWVVEDVHGGVAVRNGVGGLRAGNGIALTDAAGAVHVSAERWQLVRDGLPVAARAVEAETVEGPEGVVHHEHLQTDRGLLVVRYLVAEGEPVKVEAELSGADAGRYALVQTWSGMAYDGVVARYADGSAGAADGALHIDGPVLPTEVLFVGDGPAVRFGSGPDHDWLRSLAVDPDEGSATFTWGEWKVSEGGGFLLDPTFDMPASSSGSVEVDAPINDRMCVNSGATKIGGMTLEMPGDEIAGRCKLAYAEWNTASIPDGSTVSETEFFFTTSNLVLPEECSFVDMGAARASSSASTLAGALLGNNRYVDYYGPCDAPGNWSSVLGAGANADVEATLVEDRFTVGMTYKDFHERPLDPAIHTTTVTAPSVRITYTPPPPPVCQVPELTISGPCPGTIDVSLCGLTPGGDYAIITAAGAGSWTLPAGSPCPGLQTDLDAGSWNFRGIFVADANGEGLKTPAVLAQHCGLHVQAVDVASCTVTNVDFVP